MIEVAPHLRFGQQFCRHWFCSSMSSNILDHTPRHCPLEESLASDHCNMPNLSRIVQIAADKDHLNSCISAIISHRRLTFQVKTYAAVVPSISTFLALVSVASANEQRIEKIMITPSRTAACLMT